MAIVIDGSAGIIDIDGGKTLSTADYDTISGVLDSDNRIINGDFGIWQRGTSFSTYVYGADRWINGVIGGSGVQSLQSFAVGDTLGQISPRYFLRQTVSGQSLPSHFAATSQTIEGVRSYAGQTITVLGWARRSSGSGNMVLEGYQSFGTGGSNPVTSISSTTVTLTTTWQPFAVVMSIPSITGKIIGVNNNDALALNFWTSSGADYIARTPGLGLQTIGVDLWGIHIKYGIHTADVANLYRPRDIATESVLCQRYYRISPPLQGAMRVGNDAFVAAGFGSDMRTSIPVITLRTSGVGAIHYPAIAFRDITSIISSGVNYITLTVNVALGANTPGGILAGVFAADAEL